MRKELIWLGAAVLVYFMIRGMVPLIPMPLDANKPMHIIRAASFFGISLVLVGTLAVGALMAAFSNKKH
jgi:hypothetical protein